jgi:hypothetical protein
MGVIAYQPSGGPRHACRQWFNGVSGNGLAAGRQKGTRFQRDGKLMTPSRKATFADRHQICPRLSLSPVFARILNLPQHGTTQRVIYAEAMTGGSTVIEAQPYGEATFEIKKIMKELRA